MQTKDKTIIGPPITAEELQLELQRYEQVYQMSTVRFLERFDDPDDLMSDVEDASFWHLTWVALTHEVEEVEPPPPWAEELGDERGLERALVLISRGSALQRISVSGCGTRNVYPTFDDMHHRHSPDRSEIVARNLAVRLCRNARWLPPRGR
jgi:hypothetical protein